MIGRFGRWISLTALIGTPVTAVGACTSGEDVSLGRLLSDGASDTDAFSVSPPGWTGDALPPPGCIASPESPPCDASAGATEAGGPPFDATIDVPPSPVSDATSAGPDATPGSGDAGPLFCVRNPSFELTGGLIWQLCLGTTPAGGGAGIVNPSPTTCTLPASDGSFYLGLAVGSNAIAMDVGEGAGAPFCDPPLQPMTTYALSIDLGIASKTLVATPLPNAGPSPAFLELWGGRTPCGRDERLWTSPEVTNMDSWKAYCGAFTPSQAYKYLTLVPVLPPDGGSQTGQWSYVVVDHLVAGGTCK